MKSENEVGPSSTSCLSNFTFFSVYNSS